MVRLLCINFFIVFSSLNIAFADVVPAEGSRLNYRIIGFYVPDDNLGANIRIEIAKGIALTAEEFKAKVVVVANVKPGRNVIEVPDFGTDYVWHIVTKVKGKDQYGQQHHFATQLAPQQAGVFYQLDILQRSEKLKAAYVLVDFAGAMYDLSGKMVWFAVRHRSRGQAGAANRDFKTTAFGTLTSLSHGEIKEIDYNCNSVWRKPNDESLSAGSAEQYHHEFTRIDDGSYMVLGKEKIDLAAETRTIQDSLFSLGLLKELPQSNPDSTLYVGLKNSYFGTIIEYNAAGSVLWSWHLYPWFKSTFLTKHPVLSSTVDLHENSFFFDKSNGVIYLSLKGAAQVLKIGYPSGTVLATYGGSYRNVDMDTTHSRFCQQHSVSRTKGGAIMLFNNNTCNVDKLPTVLMFKDAATAGGAIKVSWEFKCPVGNEHRAKVQNNTSGGNAQELASGNIFMSMCTPFGDMFLVDTNKRVLWHANGITCNETNPSDVSGSTYRAHMVSRDELESLIWHNAASTKQKHR